MQLKTALTQKKFESLDITEVTLPQQAITVTIDEVIQTNKTIKGLQFSLWASKQ